MAPGPVWIDIASMTTVLAHEACMSPIEDVPWPTLVNEIESVLGTRDPKQLAIELERVKQSVQDTETQLRRLQTARFVLLELLFNPKVED